MKRSLNFKEGIKIYLKSLPPLGKKSEKQDSIGGEYSGKEYSFFIGYCDHVPEKDKIFLRIPEISQRHDEGRPRYPEQDKWVKTFLKVNEIKAIDYWFAHWQFKSEKEAEKFVKLLRCFESFEK